MLHQIQSKLTFDDVLLLPQYSEILPAETDISTNLTKNIKLQIPIISAAMDTVTESEMAIAMSLRGGIGVIHKNISSDQQAQEVKKVKRFENGFIHNPETLSPEDKIETAYNIRKQLGFKAIPITENGHTNGKLLGILTANDFFINRHHNKKIKERMTPVDKLLTAKKGISLEDARAILEESKHSKILIVDEKNRLFAMVTRRDIEKQKNFPNATLDKDKSLRVAGAVGPADLEERSAKLAAEKIDAFVIDTAHGHSKNVINSIKYLKNNYPNIGVIAGNIATPEAVEALAKAGADTIKVGIGPGSICTTRIISGIGVPQLSAIFDCAKVAKQKGIHLIADGGIKYSGDIAKAIAAGADTVMLGSLLACVNEAPGEIIYSGGKPFKIYRGMGSLDAMKKGSAERYGQKKDAQKLVPEGIEGKVLLKGPLKNELFQLIGGLRASMSYQGAKTIKEMQEKAQFVKISNASLQENHPHDITITKDSPNYVR